MENNIKIQLVETNEGFLDLAEGTNFPLTLSVSEIRDITLRKGTFSKTIKLAGSKNNNILLNQYFDVNVIAGTFNINTLQSCIVLENNIPILDNAYIQLISVNKIQSTNRHDQFVEYEVVIKDSIGDFFTKLGNAELTDLDFAEFNTTFTAANVVASFNNTVNDGFKFIMPQNITSNTYKLEEWLPGIYAKQYWDKIFANAGYQYEWTSLTGSTIQFDKLIIPYNGDQSKLNEENKALLEVIVDKTTTTDYTTAQNTNGTTIGFVKPLSIINEIKDLQGYFNLSLIKYTNALTISAPSSLKISFDIDFDFILKNQTASAVTLVAGGLYKPYINVIKNNIVSGGLWIPLSQTYTSFITPSMGGTPTSLSPGENIIYSSNINVSGNMTGLIPTDFLNFKAAVQQSGVAAWSGRIDPILRINSITMTITPNVDVLGYSYPVFVNNFIPKKIKQSDFIKAFNSLYNLYIDVDKTNRNKLIIKTRDDFYDSGVIVDWTKKLNKDKEQNITFLPDLSKKKIVLTYKQDDSDVNLKTYLTATNEIYGQQEFTFDNQYIKDVDKKEILFSPTIIISTGFGAITPSINGIEPKNNIRLLFDGGTFSCNTYKIVDYTSASVQYGALSNTQYPLFSHFNDPVDPSFDINFGICDYYGYTNLNLTNNNMYNLHWRRTMNQINNNKMLTAYFDLNGIDIYKTKLNDKIRIDNSYWNINKIMDYNPSKEGPTKVELISIDDELKLAPFKTKFIKPKYIKPIFIKSIRNIEVIRLDSLNVNKSVGSNIIGMDNQISNNILGATVIGDNNIIDGNSIVFGSNNIDTSKNSVIIGDSNNVDSTAIIVGINNVVEPNLDGVSIFGNGITATTGNTLYTNNIILSSGGTINGVPIATITGGTGTPQSLADTLVIGNTTGPNDISIDTTQSIKSGNGSGKLELDAGGIADAINLSVNNITTSSIAIDPGNIIVYADAGNSGASINLNPNNIGIGFDTITDPTSDIQTIIITDTQSSFGINSNASAGNPAIFINSSEDIDIYAAQNVHLDAKIIDLIPTGKLRVNPGLGGYELPILDGSSGDVLTTNGAGDASWQPSSGGGGTSGTSGTSGANGTSGTSGTSGGNGTSGTSGANGTSGTSGNNGTSGTSGVNGTSGTSGSSGVNGSSGTSGSSGANGSSGTSGTSGNNGSSGTSGTSGNNGTSGTSGNNGISGTSGTSGVNGTSGTSGTSGSSGSSVSITNNTNNYVLTATGTAAINGESALQYDSSLLTLTLTADYIQLNTSSSSLQTTNAVQTTIKTIATLPDYVYQIEINVVAGKTDATKGITGKFIASYINNLGTLTLIGDEFSVVNSDFTSADIALVISSGSLLVKVTGEAATLIDWGCSYVIHRFQVGTI